MSTLAAYVLPVLPTTLTSANLGSSSPALEIGTLWASSNPRPDKALESRVFWNNGKLVAAVLVAPKDVAKGGDERREAFRKAVATGVKKAMENLGTTGTTETQIGVVVECPEDAHDAAVASQLAVYEFTLKTKPRDPTPVIVPVLIKDTTNEKLNWTTGTVYAEAQNWARTLMELPANMLTPTIFCEKVVKEFEGLDNVTIHVRDEAWAKEKGMRTFLSVAQGTHEPAKFLEIHYNGSKQPNARPLAFVGKGITFDSGGISIKPSAGMKGMRADMGGAAATLASALAIARLELPLNLVVATPMTENMPGGGATKPGDVFTAMNGKTVEVDNTDAEGRLVLSDALTYVSREYKPHTLIDVATLTGAIGIALGEAFTGVFSSSPSLYSALAGAGAAEYDRMWALPLDEEGYGPQIYDSSNADLCNTGGIPAGSCTAALFLKNFVEGLEEGEGEGVKWAHLDIACTVESTRVGPYQRKGLTGRPVRALVEFARRLSGETY